MNSISVIVPTLNRPALLLDAVASAFAQARVPLEVIVVDDGSDPPVDAPALTADFGAAVRVLRNARPEGLAWARNQGVEAARGDYIVHMDDDDLFAPELLSICASLLDNQPDTEVVFIGVTGFGTSAEHFNRVHPQGTAKVIHQGGGRAQGNDVYAFDSCLLNGLLNQVSMPFQRVMARRHCWHKVSQLRWECYRQAFRLGSVSEARNLIRGTLRDSEWALYASIACQKLVLVNKPLYQQRCEGQGGSSLPAMREKHLLQSLRMRSAMNDAASLTPELRPFRSQIRSSLAQSHFNAAYQFGNEGLRGEAIAHLARSFMLRPQLRHAKLLARLIMGRFAPTRAAAA